MPPLKPFRPARTDASSYKAHMTWASHSVSRTLHSAGSFLKQQIWVWPIIAVVLLTTLGLFVRGAIERTMKASLTSELTTLRDVEVAMLRTWLHSQERNAASLANSSAVRELTTQLLTGKADAAEALGEAIRPGMNSHGYDGYFLLDEQKVIRAASSVQAVGRDDLAADSAIDEFFTRALDGQSVVSRPMPSVLPLKDHIGRVQTGTPVMFVAAPIVDENLQVVAALGLRLRPDKEFSSILQLGRSGESGETYAFDKEGRMLSSSRFDDELILLGLLPDEPGSRSILRLLVRDPGGSIPSGFRPTKRRLELPPTRMVASATAGETAADVEGYRDYRGVPVVGAWTWLPEYDFGVATEINAAEAYRPLIILRRTFWGLFTLLGLSSLAIFLFTLKVARLRREAQEAAIEAQQLGQYRLEQRLGAGAMGVVYKAKHAMLRRPTAVKMIEPNKVTPDALAAFEREVQITSQLCHPNTVAIFDYGHTPEGLFYYAMEYLDGISLQDLVEQYGTQPVGRVVDLLQQMCGSLYEAHTMGLVHRDIKPANLMLNRRGADPDVVKVLDFGLVKDIGGDGQTGIAGTPLYMPPEAIQAPATVDARSDLYAVGAVGYFLLTGRVVFEASNLQELTQMHLTETPLPPSEVRGEKLPEELDDALLACLDKNRAKRPQTARELALRLEKIVANDGWGVEKADLWWNQHERGTAPKAKPTSKPTVRGDQAATIMLD
ncbi:Serine/threonine-protein kinase PknB [Botrimarina colliarenosi]|uniref:Serine/threonine-protein kinase PknB n=1 Tax=Botrimarina colliarenosi TaxID=2528001 RepID=A0A5C6ANN8_9BACT|nr:serine/threonine protein kinase [Botrimarina colliarenosi]TWU00632.1 Serine/threonine-protein kinase PknB [Botrimarina colliarenosi]